MAKNMGKGNAEEKGKMTVGDAGRQGGEKTAATHGSEFYKKIGRDGGRANRKKKDENMSGRQEDKQEESEEMADDMSDLGVGGEEDDEDLG